MTEVPLIYTSLGNVPIGDLEYETEWNVTEAYIKLTERYRKDGLVVKESAHVLTRNGLSGEAIANDL